MSGVKQITSSTNATPIVVTSTAHGFTNGDIVVITAHVTNTAANGVWAIAGVAANTFQLTDPITGTNSVGNGVGGATGRASAWVRVPRATTGTTSTLRWSAPRST
jgi:small ligand-binding sensory domain FIST